MSICLPPRALIEDLDTLLQILVTPEDGVTRVSIYAYLTWRGASVQLIEHFGETKGVLAGSLPSRLSPVTVPVFKAAEQQRLIVGAQRPGFVSWHEYVVSQRGIDHVKSKKLG